MCMANIGRMRVNRMSRWVKRYFERQNEILRKRANKNDVRPVEVRFMNADLNVQTDMVTIRWSDITSRTVTMPREMLVPSTLTLITIHDC